MANKHFIAEDIAEKDFFEIVDGEIHWQGYFYNEGEGWRNVQYCGAYTTLEDFIGKYNNDPQIVFEEELAYSKQYIENWSDEQMENFLKEEMEDVTPINPLEITVDAPNGKYICR